MIEDEESQELAMLRRFIGQLSKDRYRISEETEDSLSVEILDRSKTMVVKVLSVGRKEKSAAKQLIQ